MKPFFLLVCGLMLGLASMVSAQDTIADPLIATPKERVFVFSGPGATFAEQGTINAGIPVQIAQRNATGTWLRVLQRADDGRVVLDGWAISGLLNLSDDLRFADVPVSDLSDGDPANVQSQSEAALYAVPIIPSISDRMRTVYERGQERGNLPFVATKIGDSVTTSPYFLLNMRRGDFVLGPYDYLRDTLVYFGPMMSESVASRVGLSSLVVFDTFWADKNVCEAGESPLACELRLKKPSVAFVMFGPNDVRSMDTDTYRENMARLVEEIMATGVIPVLITFSSHPDAPFWFQTLNFNIAMTEVAAEYEVPLLNYWVATRTLPEYGLDRDRIHLRQSGFVYLKYDTGLEARSGVSLLNLLCLRVLHEIRLSVGME